ncbi:MAG: fibrobacter succinogenes major paralogous domain-containing protein, partial [Bacteroidales bacterium]|nr:fibrobacter succinogenes major paralogous domain-containing protein [Bacteroidales bacterium]
ELNAMVHVAGTFTYTPDLGTLLFAGNDQELKVEFVPEDTEKYQPVSKTVLINVLKQDPVITWEQPMDMFFYMGDPQPLTDKQLNATVNIEGELTYIGIVAGATVLSPGKRELQVEFVPVDTDNYNTVTKSVTVHVSESAGYVTDVEGNKYHTVQIGEQVWMAENLKVTKLNDGTELVFNEFTKPTPSYDYTFYYDDERYKDAVGAIYDWKAVESEKLCPSGWHIPSDEEWKILTEFLVKNGYCGAIEYNEEGLPNINKAISSSTWLQLETMDEYAPANTKFTELINKSGFTAVPVLAHTEIIDGDRIMVENTEWWSSTPWAHKHSTNITREIYGWSGFLKERVTDSIGKSSVRCIKD